MVTMLYYRMGIKTPFPRFTGNRSLEAEWKVYLRDPNFPKNNRRVKSAMARLTKLIRVNDAKLRGRCNRLGNGLSLVRANSRMWFSSMIIAKRFSYLISSSQRPKADTYEYNRTSGNSKGRKTHEFGVSVVDLYRRETEVRRFSSSKIINLKGGDMLNELRKRNIGSKSKIYKLIHLIADIKVLILAYKSVKNVYGKVSSRTNSKISEEADLKLLKEISSDIKAGTFQFSPAKKIYTPKLEKSELKRLEIWNLKDKIVQTAMTKVLNIVYEDYFSQWSHGFRSNSGRHSALRQLKQTFRGVAWVIEGKIFKCCDNIDHKVLFEILKKRIACDKTLALIKRYILNPYFDGNRIVCPKKLGMFQGSFLSSLLFNVYLNEFDNFLTDLKKKFDVGNPYKKSSEYRRIQYAAISKETDLKTKKKLKSQLCKNSSKTVSDDGLKRIQYVRYADEFVVGVNGSLRDCYELKDKIKIFLADKLKLDLSNANTKISNFNLKGIFFLGTKIWGNSKKNKVFRSVKKDGSLMNIRITSKPTLQAPTQEILAKAEKFGFLRKTKKGTWTPTAKKNLVNLNHDDILAFYNTKVKEILNYFYTTEHRKSLRSTVRLFKHSCALTLALKFKLRRKSKAFKKFGSSLKCESTGREFYKK
jgi:retron-type reverse transcriptase